MSITVVIPAYNAERFIRIALDSVLGQTLPVDEILVVDDGSKDGTREVVEQYGDRVRLITQPNQGPSAARNLGVRSSSSELVAFLDADDSWDQTKIAKQVAAMKATPGAVLCYTGLLNLGTDGSRKTQPATPVAPVASTLRVCNPAITPSCVLLSREAFLQVGGFSNRYKGSEDWEMWIRLSRLGPFCAVDEPLTLYQISTTGLSANAEWMLGEARLLLEDQLLEGYSGIARVLWRRRILSFQLYKAALTARASKEHAKERQYILQSLLTWPSVFWHPRRYKVVAATLLQSL